MTVDAYLDNGTPEQGRTVHFYRDLCGFVHMPAYPKANPGKPVKPEWNRNDTAPLHYDLNKMKKGFSSIGFDPD